LALIIAEAVGGNFDLKYDSTKPDGTPRKLMDSGKLRKLGWTPKIPLKDGIKSTYSEMKNNEWA
jgi:GDP-L-fucose synthase